MSGFKFNNFEISLEFDIGQTPYHINWKSDTIKEENEVEMIIMIDVNRCTLHCTKIEVFIENHSYSLLLLNNHKKSFILITTTK